MKRTAITVYYGYRALSLGLSFCGILFSTFVDINPYWTLLLIIEHKNYMVDSKFFKGQGMKWPLKILQNDFEINAFGNSFKGILLFCSGR